MASKSLQPLGKRIQSRIHNKLMLALFVLFLLTFSILSVVTLFFARNALTNDANSYNSQVSTALAQETDDFFNNMVSSLKLGARQVSQDFWSFSTNDGQTPSNSLSQLGNSPFNPVTGPMSALSLQGLKQLLGKPYYTLSLLDKQGKLAYQIDESSNATPPISTTVSSMIPPKPQHLSDQPVYLLPKAGQVYTSDLVFASERGDPIITVAVPINDANNQFVGAIVAEIDFKEFIQSAFVTYNTWGNLLSIVTKDGVLVGSSHPELAQQMNYKDMLPIGTNRKVSTTLSDASKKEYLTSYSPVSDIGGWGVIVSQSSDKAYAIINQLAWPAILIIAMAICMSVFVSLLIARGITRPIRELAIAANRITTTGALDEQIAVTSQDEVGELAISFNEMIIALQKTRQALENWNHELETKVEARTYELTTINGQLEATNRELEEANLHKSQFLANMSHELRTPLNAIIGFGEVLQDQLFGPLNSRQIRYVENVVNSGRHLLNLVNDVLDLAKVEAGRMELHIEIFSSVQVIKDIQTQLSELVAKKKLVCEICIEPGLNLIEADRARYRQILYNLLSNAIKFTPEAGRITIKAKSSQTNAIFSVGDTGIGISPQDQTYIFESFRQVDSSYARQYQGTGLGLALTRKLVEMHGGKIWVESQLNQGSTFFFSLPLPSTTLVTDLFLPEPIALVDSVAIS